MGGYCNIVVLFQGNVQMERGLQGAFQAAEGVCQRERHLAAALLSAAIRLLQISHQGKHSRIYLSSNLQSAPCSANLPMNQNPTCQLGFAASKFICKLLSLCNVYQGSTDAIF